MLATFKVIGNKVTKSIINNAIASGTLIGGDDPSVNTTPDHFPVAVTGIGDESYVWLTFENDELVLVTRYNRNEEQFFESWLDEQYTYLEFIE